MVGRNEADNQTAESRKLTEKIKKKGGAELKPVSENLVDSVWGTSKPARPNEKVIVLDVEYAGKKFESKIEDLRKELDKKKSVGIVISMLDEIAWLFNLRGSDIPYNPVFFSYAVITPEDATVYVDDSKLDDEVKKHLGDVKIRPYDAIFGDIAALSSEQSKEAESKGEDGGKKEHRKFLVSSKASWALSEALGGSEKVDEVRSPVGDAKAVKNETELEGMRRCHVRDGAALTEFFAWLEDQLINKGAVLDEVQAADKLEEIRS
jgi:Xaa-Pro aminopeptidase